MARYWVIATLPPPPLPPPTRTHTYHFVWETPRRRRHSLEFPLRFFNRDTKRSNFSDAQLFENRIRIRKYGFSLEHLSNRHFCRITHNVHRWIPSLF